MVEARPTSEVDHGFPHASRSLCYLEISADGAIVQVNRYREEFRQAVRRALDGNATLYVAWPGQWATHLFIVDDLEVLAAALGIA